MSEPIEEPNDENIRFFNLGVRRGKQIAEAHTEKLVLDGRRDELKKVMKQTETGDVSIWVYKWAKDRIATLNKENK